MLLVGNNGPAATIPTWTPNAGEIRTAAHYWASQYVHTAAQIRDIQHKRTAGAQASAS
jgi:hypothetical protein